MQLHEQSTWRGAALAGGLTTHGVGSAGTLTVTPQQLTVVSVLGSFCFTPENVTCIERAGFAPWFGCGLLVRHRVKEYPQQIGFCPRFAWSRNVLKVLREYGYPVA